MIENCAQRAWCGGRCARTRTRARAAARRLHGRLARQRRSARRCGRGGARRQRARARAGAAACALALARLRARRADGAGRTLRFWAMGREGEVVQRAGARLRAREPGHPRRGAADPVVGGAREAAHRATSGRSTPDVAQLGNTWIPEFAALHALEPLDRGWRRLDRRCRARVYFAGHLGHERRRRRAVRRPVVRRHARALLPQGPAGARRLRRDARRRGTAGARRWRRSKQQAGRTTTRSSCRSTSGPSPVVLGLQAGSPLLATTARAARSRGPEFRRAFDFYVGLFQRRPRAAGRATRRSRTSTRSSRAALRDVHHRAVEPRRVPAPPARLAAGRVGHGAAARARRPRERRVDGGRLEPRAVPGARSTRTQAWQLVEFLSRPESAGAVLPPDRRPARAPRGVARSGARQRPDARRVPRRSSSACAPTPTVPEWELIATRLQERAEAVDARRAVRRTRRSPRLDRDVDRILEKRRWLLERRQRARRRARGAGAADRARRRAPGWMFLLAGAGR